MFKALFQEKYFTIDAEIAFDLNEFLDFNKVPGLDEPAEDLAARQPEHCSAAEPDLTWNKLASPFIHHHHESSTSLSILQLSIFLLFRPKTVQTFVIEIPVIFLNPITRFCKVRK